LVFTDISKLKVTIPRADEKEVAVIREGNIGFQKDVKRRFEKIDNILFGVITAVVVSLVAVVISVIGLFMDQMRYNNVAYKEYSEKIQTLESLKNSNIELLEQNKQNQELIISQNNQIIELLNKKLGE